MIQTTNYNGYSKPINLKNCLFHNLTPLQSPKLVCLLERKDELIDVREFLTKLEHFDCNRDLILDEFSSREIQEIKIGETVPPLVVQVQGWDHPAYREWKTVWSQWQQEIKDAIDLVEQSFTITEKQEDDFLHLPFFLESIAKLLVIGSTYLKNPKEFLNETELALDSISYTSWKQARTLQNKSHKLIEAAQAYLHDQEIIWQCQWQPIRLAVLANVLKTHVISQRIFVLIRDPQSLFHLQCTKNLFQALKSVKNLSFAILGCYQLEELVSHDRRIQKSQNFFPSSLQAKKTFDGKIPDLKSRQAHYIVLKNLKKGDKLQLNHAADGSLSLSISSGNNQSFGGWMQQATARKTVNLFSGVSSLLGQGFTQASHSSVINFLNQALDQDQEVLNAIAQIVINYEICVKNLNDILLELKEFKSVVETSREAFIYFVGGYKSKKYFKEMSLLSARLQNFAYLCPIENFVVKAILHAEIKAHTDKFSTVEHELKKRLNAVESTELQK